VDAKLHRVPKVLRDVEKALFPVLALGTHVISDNVRGLMEHVQLCL
jgi:hypothetical protein